MTLQNLSLQEADAYITNNSDSSAYPVGDPLSYWTFGTELNLYPAPRTGGADLLIYYTKQPTVIVEDAATADGTVLTIPLQYHNAVVEFCLAKAFELDADWQAADRKQAQYKDNLTDLRTTDDQSTEFYPSITSLPDDLTYVENW